MKLSQAVFVQAVRCIESDRSALAFVSAESPTRADGYGYELEAGDAGVFAKHPKAPGVERFIPWTNVKWVDVVAGEPAPKPQGIIPVDAFAALERLQAAQSEEVIDQAAALQLEPLPKPAREHWKTRQKREREEAAKANGA